MQQNTHRSAHPDGLILIRGFLDLPASNRQKSREYHGLLKIEPEFFAIIWFWDMPPLPPSSLPPCRQRERMAQMTPRLDPE